MMDEDKWSKEKLDSNNWPTCKIQMRHLLLAKGLWDIVEGSEVLADDATPAQRAEYKEKAQRALSIIVTSVNPSLITCFENAKDTWDHTCQPSRIGRDGPGKMAIVPIVSRNDDCPGIFAFSLLM
jgi:hypothetical protein